MSVLLRVYGIPAAQGSKKHVGGGRMVEVSKRIKPWREAIYVAVRTDAPNLEKIDGPVSVQAMFLFARPKSHFRTGQNAHRLRDGVPLYVTRTPDLDKVLRATLDPLTEMGVWGDDSQVVTIQASKRYCIGDERPGAILLIAGSFPDISDED